MSHKHHAHSHHAAAPTSNAPEELDRYQATKKVTIVGALTNLFLAIIKIIMGYLGQSQSLVADGVHSLSDLLTDAMVLIAAKHTAQDADAQHPYGHGRFETVVTVGLGSFLIIVAGGIAYDAMHRVIEPELLLRPSYITLLIAAISIAANEALYHYTIHVAKRFRSNMLRANAWHHRTDAVSSVIVMIGIGGTMLGMEYLDAIAAIGVALLIGKIGWDLCVQSIRELVDTALDPERVGHIEEIIKAIPGVDELHMLRTRQMGGDALVDVHIQVDPRLSVSEGHFISETVRARLIKEVDEVTDVMVHIDPEDDETIIKSENLPSRDKILQDLKARWQNIKEVELIERITLHYLDGQIHVELLLPLEKIEHPQKAQDIARAFSSVIRDDDFVAEIKVLFH